MNIVGPTQSTSWDQKPDELIRLYWFPTKPCRVSASLMSTLDATHSLRGETKVRAVPNTVLIEDLQKVHPTVVNGELSACDRHAPHEDRQDPPVDLPLYVLALKRQLRETSKE